MNRLYRVIAGHVGAVKCIDVDVTNQRFATGSGDRYEEIITHA